MAITHGLADKNAERGKGVHGYLGWSDVLDEAARAVVGVAQVAADVSRVIRQTGGTWAGDYVADGAGDWKAMGPSDDKVIVAPQIAADQIAFSPNGWDKHPTIVMVDQDAAREMQGMAPARGQRTIINTSSFDLTLDHENVLAVAANRFAIHDNAEIVIQPNGAATVWYDYTASVLRWRILHSTFNI